MPLTMVVLPDATSAGHDQDLGFQCEPDRGETAALCHNRTTLGLRI
jgi:hypothetical protein